MKSIVFLACFLIFSAVLTLKPVHIHAEEAHCVSGGDTVFEWSPLSPGVGPYLWNTDSNWLGTGIPDSTSECAWIADVDPASTCTFNLSSASIGSLRLQGVSPTKMTLHLRDGSLTMDDAELRDYADLDLDFNFTVNNTTTVADDVWLNIASTKTCDFGDVSVFGSSAFLHATTSGSLLADDVTIDVGSQTANKRLKFAGGTWTVEGKLLVKSAQTSGTYSGILWITAGTINVSGPGPVIGILEIDGGNDPTRDAELDIDDSLTADKTIVQSGFAKIDMASGKTMYTGEYVINGGGIVEVTGSGEVKSGSAP